MNSECVSFIVTIVSAFVAIVTLIATVMIGIMQIKQNRKVDDQSRKNDERDEQRRNDMIYADATNFILKYSSPEHHAEINLLPLCAIAYRYSPMYPYHREMYREFCSLTEETQNCILKRQNIDMNSSKYDNFYVNMLNALKVDIKKNYPNDRDLYYENGKYFKRALLYHGNKEEINIKCNADKYYTDSLNMIPNNLDKNKMNYKSHITNLLAYEKNDKPIERLMYEDTEIGIPVNDEILISYLSCIIAKYVSCYSHSYDDCKYENIGCVEDYEGKKYMEDLFLDALLNIYMYQ